MEKSFAKKEGRKILDYFLLVILLIPICFLKDVVEIPQSVYGHVSFLIVGVNISALAFYFLEWRAFKLGKNDKFSLAWVAISVLEMVLLIAISYFMTDSRHAIMVVWIVIKNLQLFFFLNLKKELSAENKFAGYKFALVFLSVLCDVISMIFRESMLILMIVMMISFAFIYLKFLMKTNDETKDALKKLSYLFYSGGIIAFMMLSGEWSSARVLYLFSCMTICTLMKCYKLLREFIYKRDLELEDARMDLSLKNEEVGVMLSQIKPHFIYNTLNTIQYLCRTDSELAAETISDFSEYLRTNLNFDSNRQIVTFEEELEHIGRYLKIEKLRFKHRLIINYETEETDFYVPTLSIQPIVENAVKHGVSKRTNGGRVTISSYMDETDFIICVKDDGVGFSRKSRKDKKKSLGIKNIQTRIETLLGGRLVIKSKENEGTEVMIYFPIELNFREDELDESCLY